MVLNKDLSRRMVNYVNDSVNLNWNTRISAINYVNNRMKCVRTESHIRFLKACRNFKCLPMYIKQRIDGEEYCEDKAVQRKVLSLGMEMLRVDIKAMEEKHRHLVQESGFLWRNLQRTRGEAQEIAQYVLVNTVTVIQAEAKTLFERHSRKWRTLCNTEYPLTLECYFNKVQSHPRFPYKINITVKTKDSHTFDNNQKFSNETDLLIPDGVSNILSKGPNFRLPFQVNSKFWERVSLNFDNLLYSL